MKNVTIGTVLHPCPYCGAQVHVSTMYGVFGIVCNDYCPESIKEEKIFASEADCIRAWQTRFGRGN